MTGTIKKQIEQQVSNPLEEYFNIEPNTTMATYTERETELAVLSDYDVKDQEIENSYQEIYDKAQDLADKLTDELDAVEGKFVARIAEVTNSLFSTALDAAHKKAQLKMHKDKLNKKTSKDSPKTVNNTLIINREDLLKQIKNNDIIDVEHIQIKTDEDHDSKNQ